MKGREISRVEAFSDGVFAFSATLLVVSLEVPTTFAALVADLKGFAAFGLSFAALVLIWSVHNAFFRRYGLQDRVTIVINACLLFVVLFYVYPLKFLAEGLVGFLVGLEHTAVRIAGVDELGWVFVLYGVGFVALFLCVALLYRHAARCIEAEGGHVADSAEAWFYCRHYLLFVGVGVLSIALAVLQVGVFYGVPGMIYVLLGPLCYLHSVRSAGRLGALDPPRVDPSPTPRVDPSPTPRVDPSPTPRVDSSVSASQVPLDGRRMA